MNENEIWAGQQFGPGSFKRARDGLLFNCPRCERDWMVTLIGGHETCECGLQFQIQATVRGIEE